MNLNDKLVSLSNLRRFKERSDERYSHVNHNHNDRHYPKIEFDNYLSELRNELLEIIYDYHPTILTLEINNTSSTIDLTKCLKSWRKITFNGEEVETIPSSTAGVIEIYNAVVLDRYDRVNNFGIAFPNGYSNSSLLTFSGDFDTSNVTNMSYMFYDCRALTSLNVSNFDTSNVTNMSSMFSNCYALTSLNLSNFDTSNVTNMSSMFYDCRALTSLDLSNFDTSNVTNMSWMFGSCNALTSIDLSNFDTSNVTNMSYMFYYCRALTSLNVSNFDTSKVTDMDNMFSTCNALTSLDLSNFDTINVTNMDSMFGSCYALTSIDLSGQTVTLNTVQKISAQANMPTQMKTIYVLDSSKHNGLNYANITYAYK